MEKDLLPIKANMKKLVDANTLRTNLQQIENHVNLSLGLNMELLSSKYAKYPILKQLFAKATGSIE